MIPLFGSAHDHDGTGRATKGLRASERSPVTALIGRVSAVLVGCLALTGCMKAPAQAPPLPPPAVTISNPLEKDLADFAEFTGQTAAVKTVEVRARVWGYLQSVNFTEGALVRKGDLLFQIDPRPYQALVNQAKAKIAQDQAQLTN